MTGPPAGKGGGVHPPPSLDVSGLLPSPRPWQAGQARAAPPAPAWRLCPGQRGPACSGCGEQTSLHPSWQSAQEDGRPCQAAPTVTSSPHPVSCSPRAHQLTVIPTPHPPALTLGPLFQRGLLLSSTASGSDHHQQAKARNPSRPSGGPGVREEENRSLELSGWGRERPTVWARGCRDPLGRAVFVPHT